MILIAPEKPLVLQKKLRAIITFFLCFLLSQNSVSMSQADFITLQGSKNMTRKKRTSRILEKAEIRLSGLKAVDPVMDFGDSRSLVNMMLQMDKLRDRIEDYNRALAVIDSSKKEIDELEKSLGDLTDKMLIGVAFKYGKDSHQYEMAGGMRKSERIRKSSASRMKNKANQIGGENSQPA